MAVEMTPEVQAKLRDKFETRVIGKKPKIYCSPCSKSPSKVCGDHKKARCKPLPDGCGQNITEAHLHISFVSHAEVTDRLLDVDPAWSWEPLGFEPNGLPAMDARGGLWIKLTVAGVTRIGYGGADGKDDGRSGEAHDNAVKEAVSDAIKTTAMRFGVGLDLWRKSEEPGKTAPAPAQERPASRPRPAATTRPAQNGRPAGGERPATQRPEPKAADQTPQAPAQAPQSAPAGERPPFTGSDALEELDAVCVAMEFDRGMVEQLFASARNGADLRKASQPVVRAWCKHLDNVDPTLIKRAVGATA